MDKGMDFFNEVDKAVDAKYSGDQAPSVDEKPDQEQVAKEADAPKEDNTPVEIPDLAKLGKFMLDGKEVTYSDLVKQRMLHDDYTRKTQQLAEVRRQAEESQKYADNFNRDVETVLRDPSLLSEFKKIYPKQYHSVVESLLNRIGQTSQPQNAGQSTQTGDQKQLIEKIVEERLGPLKEKVDQYEKKEALAQLDSIFNEMKGKYPQADEEFVTARLLTLKDNGVNIDRAKIEEVHKYFHDKIEGSKKAYYEEQIKKQTEANRKAKDVPSGGGTAGQAPKKFNMNNTREIEDAMIAHLRRTEA